MRRKLRDDRSKLNSVVQYQAALTIATKVGQSPFFKQSQKIAFYMAINGEIDVGLLIKIAWQQQKSCYLPITDKKNALIFIRYQEGDLLQKNQWGIPEPHFDNDKRIEPEQLDLVVMPLVGFTSQLYRLGQGGGFYDKTFAHKIKSPHVKPYLLGVAYQFQQIEFMPREWDVKMDGVEIAP